LPQIVGQDEDSVLRNMKSNEKVLELRKPGP